MSKIKLTKGELKKQRDSLKQFRRYLPTLQLKKQQLQMKILEVRTLLSQRNFTLIALQDEINEWSGLLADTSVDLKTMITPKSIEIDTVNVAGASIPFFKCCIFSEIEIDLYETPFWIDQGIEKLRKMASSMAEVETIKTQIRILEKELRVTTQRVNLFEKVKIPECQKHIRKIGIYLGDQQANAVGVSKVAKKKVEQKAEARLTEAL